MSETGNIGQTYFIIFTRLTTKNIRTMEHVICTGIRSLFKQNVFVHTSPGTFLNKIFLIKVKKKG